MFQMLGVFAEFERAMIVERVPRGIEASQSPARLTGKGRRVIPAMAGSDRLLLHWVRSQH